MNPDEVLLARDGPCATVTIAREEHRNALGYDALRLLKQRLEDAAADPEVRVIVLTGAGDKAFSAGGDLSAIQGGGLLAMHEGRRFYIEVLKAILDLPKPTIARINGHALGGGLGLALACDLSVAADSAKLGTPEVNLGLFPFMILPLILEHATNRKRALEMVLAGQTLTAADACALGLVGRVVPPSGLDSAVADLAARVASRSPTALFLGRRAARRVRGMPLDGALDYLAAMLTVTTLTDDAAEGVAAFIERREPSWKGT